MWQVSNTVLETVSAARQPHELQRWASSLAERFTEQARDEGALETLKKLLAIAEQHYSQQLALVDHWWDRWLMEVKALHRAVGAMNEAWGKSGYGDGRGTVAQASVKLWMTANSPSALQTSMSREGVRFKSGPIQTVMSGPDVFGMQPWIPLFLAAMAGGRWGRDEFGDRDRFGRDGLYLWREWIEFERERRIEPQVHIALSCLRTRYGDRDPFDEFVVGRHPATRSLRELVNENILPNGGPSPWLHAWTQTLEAMPGSSMGLPKPTDEGDSRLSGLRLADSAIKRSITDEMRPTESWSEFVQRLFERKWVERVGSMAGAANKKAGEAKVIWTLDDLVAFIGQVVAQLNEIGYALLTPERRRLEELLKKTSRGEGVYGEDAW